jgi:phospholipase A1
MFRGNADLFYAYTQRSFWQLYHKALSSPFRETNHEPELFVKFDTDFSVLGLKNRLFLIGLNHQSNGRGGVLSRSWNRIYAEFIAERGNFVIALKPWYRIPEDAEDDDNPEIEKYMGYGELLGAYRLNGHVFSFMFRNNLRGDHNRGAVQFGWSYPITHNVRVYVQYFNGYGESLVDYNDNANRIGIGVMLFDWI